MWLAWLNAFHKDAICLLYMAQLINKYARVLETLEKKIILEEHERTS
jgi:hypothetical protein